MEGPGYNYSQEGLNILNPPPQTALQSLFDRTCEVAEIHGMEELARQKQLILEDNPWGLSELSVHVFDTPRVDSSGMRHAVTLLASQLVGSGGVVKATRYELWWRPDSVFENGAYFELRFGSGNLCGAGDAEKLLDCLSD